MDGTCRVIVMLFLRISIVYISYIPIDWHEDAFIPNNSIRLCVIRLCLSLIGSRPYHLREAYYLALPSYSSEL